MTGTGQDQSSTNRKHVVGGAARKYQMLSSRDLHRHLNQPTEGSTPTQSHSISATPSVVVKLVPTILPSFIRLAKPSPSISSGDSARNEILPVLVPSSCCLAWAAICFKDILQETTALATEKVPLQGRHEQVNACECCSFFKGSQWPFPSIGSSST